MHHTPTGDEEYAISQCAPLKPVLHAHRNWPCDWLSCRWRCPPAPTGDKFADNAAQLPPFLHACARTGGRRMGARVHSEQLPGRTRCSCRVVDLESITVRSTNCNQVPLRKSIFVPRYQRADMPRGIPSCTPLARDGKRIPSPFFHHSTFGIASLLRCVEYDVLNSKC